MVDKARGVFDGGSENIHQRLIFRLFGQEGPDALERLDGQNKHLSQHAERKADDLPEPAEDLTHTLL